MPVVVEDKGPVHGTTPRRAAVSTSHLRARSLPWTLLASDSEEVVTLAIGSEPGVPFRRRAGQLAPLLKRAGDIMIALLALIVLAPLMLTIGLTIKATDPGPVFFAHTRIGRKGRSFRCWKFRTMVVDADRRLRKLIASDERLAQQWHMNRKLADDPRITRLGWLLRKSSLDELPQLFNVLRGEMSCVGPRPVTAEELERYGDIVHDYLQVRPGITGLWQVCGRNQCSYAQRVALDRLYVHKWSLGLDLAIVVRTIPTLLKFDETA